MADTTTYEAGMDLTAKTFAGLEEVLANELRDLGALDVKPVKRAVQFRGDEELIYKANYLCRTAIRILKPVGVFKVTDQEELYKKVRKIDWTKVFTLDQTFVVNANLFHSELTHSHYVALRTKDAIVDQFRDKTGKRPWVGKENADIFIDVHISHDVCTVSLDSSGESLHRRGYRIAADKAPISEVLAAGMVKLTGWNGESDFYDPMCGSGTIAIEAAMLVMNIPAGYYRKKFAFMNWAGYNAALWEKVKEEADSGILETEHRIFASDRSEKAVNITKQNLKNAGLHKDVEVSKRYFDTIRPEEAKGILVFNPPYGKRLEERGEIVDLYKGIGDVLKQHFTGFEAWIITANPDVAKFIGLRPSARIPLYNGPIESKFIKFSVYEGSKREKYQGWPTEKSEYKRKSTKPGRHFSGKPRPDRDKKRGNGSRSNFKRS